MKKAIVAAAVACVISGCGKSAPKPVATWQPVAWQYMHNGQPCVTLENAGSKDGGKTFGYMFEVMGKRESPGVTDILTETTFVLNSDEAAFDLSGALLGDAEAICGGEAERLTSITQSAADSTNSNIVSTGSCNAAGSESVCSTGSNNSITINGKKVQGQK